MAVTEISKFDRSTFTSEFTALCNSLDAPCSQDILERILTAFGDYLNDAYVWLRATSKASDVVNFRLAFHGKQVETTSISIQHDLLPEVKLPLAKIVDSWSSSDDAEQWCDFDPSRGVAKIWVYFMHTKPLGNILSTPGLPPAVAARIPDLEAVGLVELNFAAVDYTNQSMNVYFLVQEPLTFERAASYTGLAGSTPPEADVQLMAKYTSPMFTFGVTIIPETGHIPRVAFYGAVPNADTFSPLNDRLRKFFAECPSHDEQQLHIVCWSYGAAGSSIYMKGESSYVGWSPKLSTEMVETWMQTPA